MEEASVRFALVDINEILKTLPHRYPMLIIEAMAQTAGVIAINSVERTEKPRAVYFLTIDKCKFRKPVMPGDTIEYHMRSIGRRKTMWWFHGDAIVNGTTVAEADVGAMLSD